MSQADTMQLSRIAGALLLSGGDAYFLIGNLKEPCDWARVGFEPPPELEPGSSGIRELTAISLATRELCEAVTVDAAGRTAGEIAVILANRLLIRRNASVSERLWRLLTGTNDENDNPIDTDATWLVMMPERVWDVVRDAALRCL